ncbi:MAG TPA: transporter substrate-binding domain-containing protein, partial [Bacteroidia bacterium]|nr:transporter substrate-binding domain-containing protein [Bacteroidia bacterium]
MWKKYKILFSLIVLLTSLLEVKKCTLPGSASTPKDDYTNIEHRDLDQVKKSKKLVLLTENSSTSYFIYKGQPMGYEYEMMNAFAQSIGVELDVVVVRNVDNIFQMLDSCQGDVAADNLTVTSNRRKDVEFTSPLFNTRQ